MGQDLQATGLAMLENADAWNQVDKDVDRVREATERHGELWKEVRACLKERDSWNSKLTSLHQSAQESTSVETQMTFKTLRGQVATSKSKEYAAATRAYAVTHRRVLKLDVQVLKLLRDIRAIEQNFTIDPTNRLDDALQEAVMEDDPSKVQALLSSLPRMTTSPNIDQIIRQR